MVAKSVAEKQHLFRIYQKSRMACSSLIAEQHKRAYNFTKYEAKGVINRTQVEERRKFGERLQGEDRKGKVFRVLK